MTNPIRPCGACRVFDDHPRHEIIDPVTGADVLGGPMHMDCCANLRECQTCALQLRRAYALAGAGAIGDDLRQGLEALPALAIDHGTEQDPFTVIDWQEI